MKHSTVARVGISVMLISAMVALHLNFAVAADRTVNVYNWSDYVDPQVLKDFTAETGIKVVYDVYDSNDIVETKLLAGGSGYDIVVPSDINLAREIKAGALMPLDKSKLPNLSHMWPFITEQLQTYDPGNRYAVNYMWGTNGLGYNVDKVHRIIPMPRSIRGAFCLIRTTPPNWRAAALPCWILLMTFLPPR